MVGGRKLLLVSGALAAASCTASHRIEVRAIPDPAASKSGTSLAQARGQLALGNVGLALESLRTLQREQPENPQVFEGIAQCYAAMSRYDLVRTNLEFALAYAPDDPQLLNEMAVALDQLGDHDQAAQVRLEAARLRSAPATRAASQQPEVTPMGVPRAGSLTVMLPAASQTGSAAALEAAKLPPARTASSPSPHLVIANSAIRVAAAPGSVEHSASSAERRLPRIALLSEKALVASQPLQLGRSNSDARIATIAPARADVAAPPRPLGRPQVLVAPIAPAMPAGQENASATTRGQPRDALAASPSRMSNAVTAATRPPTAPVADRRRAEGPYLERTSRGEVALITERPQVDLAKHDMRIAHLSQVEADLPEKRRPAGPRAPSPAVLAMAVQWVPLKYASMPQNVELLNAARSQGLAARTRIALEGRGWRKIRIGDARKPRERSVVLYSAERRQIAHRLAMQFHCGAVKVAGLRNVVVLLGRDAAARHLAGA